MSSNSKILELLETKRELFIQYEAETEKIKSNSADETDLITEVLSKRDSLRVRIEQIDNEIEETCRLDENGELLYKAAKNTCDYGTLPPELKTVFDAGQKIYQVIARIQSDEELVLMNFKKVKDQLQELIKQNKKDSKLAGYLKYTGTGNMAKMGSIYDKKR